MVNIAIMAGGKGERFWPKSLKSMPKQFQRIVSDKTMIQGTFYRIYPKINKDNIYFIANELLTEIIKRQIPEISERNLIIEPFEKNTAAAIGLAATYIKRSDPDGVMVVLTADHVVEPEKEFIRAIDVASKVAEKGYLVTFGITPDRTATEYGYIEVDKKFNDNYGLGVYKVKTFCEKPDIETANDFIEKGNYFWNSGMFVFKVSVILKEIERHAPKLFSGLLEIEKSIGTDREKETKIKEFEKFDNISVDYAVMEKAELIACVKPEYKWDDVGSWNGLYRHKKKDNNGNISEGQVVIVDSKDTIVLGDDNSVVAAVGLDGIIIVKNGDRILVCNKDKDQLVKSALKVMKKSSNFEKYL